jgi:hypothetical protein
MTMVLLSVIHIHELAIELASHVHQVEPIGQLSVPDAETIITRHCLPVAESVRVLEALVQELVDRYTKQPVAERHHGCGWCGGLPHTTECLVGRMETALKRR